MIKTFVKPATVDKLATDRPMTPEQMNIAIETLARELDISRVQAAQKAFAFTFGIDIK